MIREHEDKSIARCAQCKAPAHPGPCLADYTFAQVLGGREREAK